MFTTHPLHHRVSVYARDGTYLGHLRGGWELPFALRITSPGTLVLLDSGGFPGPDKALAPSLHWLRYPLSWGSDGGVGLGFETERVISFSGLPFGFAEDFEVLRTGDCVVTDSVLGSIWVVTRGGDIIPALVPTLQGVNPPPLLASGHFPGVLIQGVPFRTHGDFAPGVGSVGANDTHLYFGTTASGGIHRIALEVLLDSSLSYQTKVDALETVSPGPQGRPEVIKGLTFNRFDTSDPYLYAVDSFNATLFRVDVETGNREVLAKDEVNLDFPCAAQFLPPVGKENTLVVTSDQEYRLPELNPAIEKNLCDDLPFTLTYFNFTE